MRTKEFKFHKADLKLLFYSFFALIFLYVFGIPAIKGEIDFEFFADSETYMEFMEENLTISQIFVLSPNMVGPSIILMLLFENYTLVFLFNVFILYYFYFTLSKYYELDKNTLLFFIVISPIFFSSLIGINKEIIAVLSITLFFRYEKTGSIWLLLLSLLFSICVRWQMTMFILILTFITSRLNLFRNYHKVSLICFLLMVSVFYYMNLSSFESFNQIVEHGQDTSTEGSGLFFLLIQLQNSNPFGYVITWLPKVLFLMVGLLARFQKVFDFSDLYNNFITFWQCVLNLYVFILLWRHKIKISNIFVFSAIVYSIIFGLSPIFSPRYMFPIYVLLTIAIAQHKKKYFRLLKN